MSTNRLRARFETPGKKLIAYVTCGDPTLDATVEIVRAAERAGADAVELGIPFSDPSADGPAIQRAMERAIARGANLAGALDVVRRVRAAGCQVPIVLFGYYNPIFVRGVERFTGEAAQAGADGILVVDVPLDELDELAAPARKTGLEVVPLLAPTSTPARMARVKDLAPAFVYYISINGITGAALKQVGEIEKRVAEVRQATGAPVAVGFGITTPDDARAIGEFSDAIVVGSAIVRTIEANPGREGAAVEGFVAELKRAVAG